MLTKLEIKNQKYTELLAKKVLNREIGLKDCFSFDFKDNNLENCVSAMEQYCDLLNLDKTKFMIDFIELGIERSNIEHCIIQIKPPQIEIESEYHYIFETGFSRSDLYDDMKCNGFSCYSLVNDDWHYANVKECNEFYLAELKKYLLNEDVLKLYPVGEYAELFLFGKNYEVPCEDILDMSFLNKINQYEQIVDDMSFAVSKDESWLIIGKSEYLNYDLLNAEIIKVDYDLDEMERE